MPRRALERRPRLEGTTDSIRSKSARWRARVWIEGFSPYQCLAMLVIPVCLVEPLKLVAIALLGEGHWIAGTSMITAAYAVSILLVERLLILFKPKLLKLRWFAWLWASSVIIKYKLLRPFRRIASH